MLIDDIKIEITAGHGGNGCSSFNKNLMSLGPAGGSGGNGGNIIFKGVSDLNALGQFRYKKQIDAPNGRDGKGQFCDGPNGKDLIVKIPVGTVIHNLDTNEDSEITKVDQEILIAKGGRGGRGRRALMTRMACIAFKAFVIMWRNLIFMCCFYINKNKSTFAHS